MNTSTAERFAIAVLRAESSLAARNFSAGHVHVRCAQVLAESSHEDMRVKLVEAHLAALVGDARQALRLVVPLLRRCPAPSRERARSLWVLGLICYRRGHYRWSRKCFGLSGAIYKLEGDNKELAHVLINQSLLEKSEGQIHRAIACLDDATVLMPKRYHSKTRFRLLVNRGICLFKLGELDGSRNCLMAARSLGADSNELVFLVMIYNNLGHIYRLQQNYRVATEFYEAALALAKRERSTRQECLALEFIGETRTEQGDYESALAHLDAAHELASRLAPHGDLMMEVTRRRGEAYAAKGSMERAHRDLSRSIEICTSRGEKRELSLAVRALELAFTKSEEQFASTMREVLSALDEVGDRFEYARTVCLALAHPKVTRGVPPGWLTEPIATAQHYLASMNLQTWLDRIQGFVGSFARRAPRAPSEDETPIIQRSTAFKRAVESARLAASTEDPVLIQGETGTGKEVMARFTHSLSARRNRPFVAINCGAIPETLVESELFGHTQGAFTGAGSAKPGLIESADGGTVLLDEIVDLPIHSQVKLLRFLDSGELRRVGETRCRHADVRVMAATNRDLLDLVSKGAFRADLYYRLDVFKVAVPPLRRRCEDVLPLAEQFLLEAAHGGARPPSISPELARWLRSYEWPGNVRQLRNLCRYLFAKAWGRPRIGLEHLPSDLSSNTMFSTSENVSSFERERLELERDQLTRALRKTRGNISKAAILLGVGRNGVARRLKEFGIEKSSFL